MAAKRAANRKKIEIAKKNGLTTKIKCQSMSKHIFLLALYNIRILNLTMKWKTLNEKIWMCPNVS